VGNDDVSNSTKEQLEIEFDDVEKYKGRLSSPIVVLYGTWEHFRDSQAKKKREGAAVLHIGQKY